MREESVVEAPVAVEIIPRPPTIVETVEPPVPEPPTLVVETALEPISHPIAESNPIVVEPSQVIDLAIPASSPAVVDVWQAFYRVVATAKAVREGLTDQDVPQPFSLPVGKSYLSSATDSSIAPSSPRSELGMSAQWSDIGDDTRSEVSEASLNPVVPSSPRPSIDDYFVEEDFVNPKLRMMWKKETPASPSPSAAPLYSPTRTTTVAYCY